MASDEAPTGARLLFGKCLASATVGAGTPPSD
jgi:hypothetical protein